MRVFSDNEEIDLTMSKWEATELKALLTRIHETHFVKADFEDFELDIGLKTLTALRSVDD